MNGFSWKRALTESAVVVASILLAFAIDAWWQEREARDLEVLAIAGIRSDFESHIAEIDTSLVRNRTREAAADSLLQIVGPEAVAQDPERILRHMGHAAFLATVSFQGGSLATLTNTSGLASIRNPDLRLALSDWLQALEFNEVMNTWAYDETARYSALLDDRVPLGDLDRAAGYPQIPPSRFQAEFTPLLRSVAFGNRVYQQRYVSLLLIGHMTRMREIAERVLELSASE
jgi:hypothetical protein